MDSLLLAPPPRQIERAGGALSLGGRRRIALVAPDPQALLPAARRLQAAFLRAGVAWELSAAPLAAGSPGALLAVDPALAARPQGYRLTVGPGGVQIVGHDPAGVFYGVCTLIQIVEQVGARLPALAIDDWPDFPARGVMLDISRDRVPTMAYLRELVDMLAGWKINQLQLYTEHTFAYARHPAVWRHASPLTGDEILELDAFCRERCVELVPNQNSFGHMERWLVHPHYAHLAETQGEFDTPWGHTMRGPFTLCPGDPGSLELVRGLLDELLPHFRSRMVNVGCDETIDLGQGRSRAVCEERGHGRVYLDFLQALHREVGARGRMMQYWGDIILNHPELIGELPPDAIALNWGYESTHPFDVECGRFAAAGLPFYVCPGTSTWNSLAGRTENAVTNIASAAASGLRHGAIGLLNTDWGDRGHWQAPLFSYPAMLAGAAFAWSAEASLALDVARATGLHALADPSGAAGRALYDLGNVYRELPYVVNSSALFLALQLPLDELAARRTRNIPLEPEMPARALAAIDAALGHLSAAQVRRPDAALVAAEVAHAAALMRHACRRLALTLDRGPLVDPAQRLALHDELHALVAEQRRLWLARSRPGGLEDSVARFAPALADYA